MYKSLPRHYYLMSILGVVLSLVMVGDYLLTMLRVPAWLDLFTDAQIDLFLGLPQWMQAAWAVSIWGFGLGAVMMLLRSGPAPLAFMASVIGGLVYVLWLWLVIQAQAVIGMNGVYFLLVICALQGMFYLYSRALHKRGYI
jgi:hypothetical protein